MSDDKRTVEQRVPQETDERAIARKFGLRELVYPDNDQVKALASFLGAAVESGKCGTVPKTAVVVMLEFLQATLNRQHLTKSPRMSQDEFDAITTPYYLAARIIGKLAREKKEKADSKGRIYQMTYLQLHHFIEMLKNLLDPTSAIRGKRIPDTDLEVMEVLWDFVLMYPEARRKGRLM